MPPPSGWVGRLASASANSSSESQRTEEESVDAGCSPSGTTTTAPAHSAPISASSPKAFSVLTPRSRATCSRTAPSGSSPSKNGRVWPFGKSLGLNRQRGRQEQVAGSLVGDGGVVLQREPARPGSVELSDVRPGEVDVERAKSRERHTSSYVWPRRVLSLRRGVNSTERPSASSTRSRTSSRVVGLPASIW